MFLSFSGNCQDGSLFKTKHKDEFNVKPTPSRSSNEDPQNFSSTLEYAQFCKKELGLPDEVLKPWNCLDGLEIPITIDGKSLNAENYQLLASGKLACDRASWLIPEESCINYAFILERDLGPDVKGVIICRNRKFTTFLDKAKRRLVLDHEKSIESLLSYYQIDTAGLIWTHLKTGKTCFFDFRGKYGGYIPSPDDPKIPRFEELPEPKFLSDSKGKQFSEINWFNPQSGWQSPQFVANTDQCIRCHDSGPFLSSPWLAQVYSPPRPERTVPYIVVGGLFSSSPHLMPPSAISTAKVTSPRGQTEEQFCTTCHRIGKHFSCSNLFPYSIAIKSPQVFPHGNAPLPPIWMPPTPQTNKAQWDALYGHHTRHLQCCCQNPSALGCVVFDLTKTPPTQGESGKGPLTCP